jgi:hypothetical protein
MKKCFKKLVLARDTLSKVGGAVTFEIIPTLLCTNLSECCTALSQCCRRLSIVGGMPSACNQA